MVFGSSTWDRYNADCTTGGLRIEIIVASGDRCVMYPVIRRSLQPAHDAL